MENKKSLKVYNMPAWLFAVCTAVLLVTLFFFDLPQNMLGAFAFGIIGAEILFFVGDAIPIVGKYLGGGSIVCILGSAALSYYGAFSPELVDFAKSFTGSFGFLDFCIASLIVGSILGMDAKTLVKCGIRYFVAIAGCIIFAFVGTGLLGMVLGYGFSEAILYIAAPIIGGGVGAGAIPMAEIYAGAYGLVSDDILAQILPATIVGNAIAILMGCLVLPLAQKFPKLSGDGVLIEGMVVEPDEVEKNHKLSLNDLGIGLVMSGTFLLIAVMVGKFVTFLHYYAILVILAVVVKLSKFVPRDIEISCSIWYQFIGTQLMKALMFFVGVSMLDFGAILTTLTDPVYFILIVVTVVLAFIGAGIFGQFVGFKFLESATTAGLCMANAGGSGDVCILTASKRLSLMPFAAISSRIGGAIILLLMGALTQIL